jgi:hypothetical protein
LIKEGILFDNKQIELSELDTDFESSDIGRFMNIIFSHHLPMEIIEELNEADYRREVN